MSPPTYLPLPSGRPGRSREKRLAMILLLVFVVGIIALFAYGAGRRSLFLPAGTAAGGGPDVWSGIWFTKKDAGDGVALPAVELRQTGQTLAGRLIRPGPGGNHDVGLPLEELAAAGDEELTFVTTGGGRVKYRLARAGRPDAADLYTLADPGHELGSYLGSGGGTGPSTHSAERRERLLQQLSAPPPPELIARLVRVNVQPGVFPAVRPDRPARDPNREASR